MHQLGIWIMESWEGSRAMVSENLRSKILFTQYIWDTELLYLKIFNAKYIWNFVIQKYFNWKFIFWNYLYTIYLFWDTGYKCCILTSTAGRIYMEFTLQEWNIHEPRQHMGGEERIYYNNNFSSKFI